MAQAGVADAQEARIEAHPHLRANRFVAALAQDADVDDAAFERDAMPMLRTLDRDARAAEIANLPGEWLSTLGTSRADAAARTETCATELLRSTRLIRRAVRVPDDYSGAQRVLGAYALTRHPFTAGVQRHLAQAQAAFDQPLAPPAGGTVVRHAVAGEGVAGGPVAGIDPALFDRHQPVFDIETTHADDAPGELVWNAAQGRPVLRSEQPAVYRHVAYTRYHGRTLTQLVYTIWFAARPAEGAVDLLAGYLDGLVWRVTLDAHGRALVYDSIHPCGCYHYFIATPRANALPVPPGEPEWAFVPQRVREPLPDERVVLRVASRSHYLQRVTIEARDAAVSGAVLLQVLAQDRLRTLPVWSDASGRAAAGSGGTPIVTRSAYGPDGLVPGTERGERFVLWPTGITSAGQMRQWGRHATAFVGRRHFDDADLFEKRFEFDLGALGSGRAQ